MHWWRLCAKLNINMLDFGYPICPPSPDIMSLVSSPWPLHIYFNHSQAPLSLELHFKNMEEPLPSAGPELLQCRASFWGCESPFKNDRLYSLNKKAFCSFHIQGKTATR